MAGNSGVQFKRAERRGDWWRFGAEWGVVVGIESAQRPLQPGGEAGVARESYAIAAAGVVFERFL